MTLSDLEDRNRVRLKTQYKRSNLQKSTKTTFFNWRGRSEEFLWTAHNWGMGRIDNFFLNRNETECKHRTWSTVVLRQEYTSSFRAMLGCTNGRPNCSSLILNVTLTLTVTLLTLTLILTLTSLSMQECSCC